MILASFSGRQDPVLLPQPSSLESTQPFIVTGANFGFSSQQTSLIFAAATEPSQQSAFTFHLLRSFRNPLTGVLWQQETAQTYQVFKLTNTTGSNPLSIAGSLITCP